jgi:hypothetical protein
MGVSDSSRDGKKVGVGMSKYRKKPVVIEAFQFLPDSDGNYFRCRWPDYDELVGSCGKAGLLIKTLEGTMRAVPGDWLIRGVKGEVYPCKPDIFEATYEKVME